jgi:hypothetical protein
MNEKLFATRKIDPGTHILETQYLQHGEYDLLIEKWRWDGITAKSLIFLSQQIKNLSNTEVEQISKNILSLPEAEKTTLSRNADFTYLNFGFIVD